MARFHVGIDLGGTSAKLVLADLTGDIVLQDSFPTGQQGSPDLVLSAIGTTVRKMLSRLGTSIEQDLVSIGIGVPGSVDNESGITKFFPNMPTQWRDVPVAQTLASGLGVPVRVMNDARTATLGELRFGCGKDLVRPTFAFFSIGTGIGGGVVIDGKLRLGPIGSAGELGHQTIAADGPRCGCGNQGCLEAIASGTAIIAAGVRLMNAGAAPALGELTGHDPGAVTPLRMVQACESDPAVAEAIENAAIAIGIAAANVVVVLHPDRIVLGGGVSAMGERLSDTVKRVITERVGMFPTEDVIVECSKLGSTAGVRGAIALAMTAR